MASFVEDRTKIAGSSGSASENFASIVKDIAKTTPQKSALIDLSIALVLKKKLSKFIFQQLVDMHVTAIGTFDNVYVFWMYETLKLRNCFCARIFWRSRDLF